MLKKYVFCSTIKQAFEDLYEAMNGKTIREMDKTYTLSVPSAGRTGNLASPMVLYFGIRLFYELNNE